MVMWKVAMVTIVREVGNLFRMINVLKGIKLLTLFFFSNGISPINNIIIMPILYTESRLNNYRILDCLEWDT